MNRERVILNEEQIQKLITGLEDMVRDLRQKVNQLETNRDEAIKVLLDNTLDYTDGDFESMRFQNDIVAILERGKE